MPLHKTMTNHPTDASQKELHQVGYYVADAAALAAITTAVEGDIAYQADTNWFYFYTGAAWAYMHFQPPIQHFNAATLYTVAGGIITVTTTHCKIETQDGDPTDDLDTINSSLIEGDILILRAADDTHTVVVKSGTGNIFMSGGDCTLDDQYKRLMLISDGTNWVDVARNA